MDSSKIELIWSGKYDSGGRRVKPPRSAHPPSLCETYLASGPLAENQRNQLIIGDNLSVMAALLATHKGKVDLVYADPPFGTGTDYVCRTEVGDAPPAGRQGAPLAVGTAFRDTWPGGLGQYLAMLDLRLQLVRDLLAPHGSFYLHVDPTVGHAAKLLCDDVFGPASFQREIVWRIGWLSGYKTAMKNWIRNHDLIFFYVKDPKSFCFNKLYVDYPEGYRRRDGSRPKGKGMPIEDVWNANAAEFALTGSESLDSIQIKSFSMEKTGYATQKNESLLRRIILASSMPGDLVADFFCGSGTTAVAAQSLGRRWVACDSNPQAIHTAKKRLLINQRGSFEILQVRNAKTLANEPKGPKVFFEQSGERHQEVRITNYAPATGRQDHPQVRKRIRDFSDYLDFWSVGAVRDGVFYAQFSAFRTRSRPALPLAYGPILLESGDRIEIRTVDLFGDQAAAEITISDRQVANSSITD